MNGKEVFQLGKLGKCSTGFVQFLLKLHRLFQHLCCFPRSLLEGSKALLHSMLRRCKALYFCTTTAAPQWYKTPLQVTTQTFIYKARKTSLSSRKMVPVRSDSHTRNNLLSEFGCLC